MFDWIEIEDEDGSLIYLSVKDIEKIRVEPESSDMSICTKGGSLTVLRDQVELYENLLSYMQYHGLRSFKKKQPLEEVEADPELFRLVDLIGENLITYEDGEVIHDFIVPFLYAHTKVIIDFDEVKICAAPFSNAAFGKLYEQFSEEGIERLVEFKMDNLQAPFINLISRVMENAKEFYNLPLSRRIAISNIVSGDNEEEEQYNMQLDASSRVEAIKSLRKLTGLDLKTCKHALEITNYDIDKAVDIGRQIFLIRGKD